jgi:hypothetical protein
MFSGVCDQGFDLLLSLASLLALLVKRYSGSLKYFVVRTVVWFGLEDLGLRLLCWEEMRGYSGWMGRRKWMGMM